MAPGSQHFLLSCLKAPHVHPRMLECLHRKGPDRASTGMDRKSTFSNELPQQSFLHLFHQKQKHFVHFSGEMKRNEIPFARPSHLFLLSSFIQPCYSFSLLQVAFLCSHLHASWRVPKMPCCVKKMLSLAEKICSASSKPHFACQTISGEIDHQVLSSLVSCWAQINKRSHEQWLILWLRITRYVHYGKKMFLIFLGSELQTWVDDVLQAPTGPTGSWPSERTHVLPHFRFGGHAHSLPPQSPGIGSHETLGGLGT